MQIETDFTAHLYLKTLKRLLDENYFRKLECFEDRIICGFLFIQSGPFVKEKGFLKKMLMNSSFTDYSKKHDNLSEELQSFNKKNILNDFLKSEFTTNVSKKNRAHKMLKDLVSTLEKSYEGSEVDLRLKHLQNLIRCSDQDIDALVALVHLKLMGPVLNKMPLFCFEYRETDRFNERIFKRENVVTLMGLNKQLSSSVLSKDGIIVQGRLVEISRFDMVSISENIFNYLTSEEKSDISNILQLEKRNDGHAFSLNSFSLDSKDIEICQKLLQTNKKTILFIEGSCGTGKSEFAKSLVKSVKKNCLWVPSAQASNGEDALQKRRSIFQLASLVCNPSDTVVILDEADEVLNSSMDNPFRFLNPELSTNKDLLNGLFDRATAQIIIIVNRNTLDASVLRRCSLTLKFPDLDQSQRLKMIEHTFIEHGVENYFDNNEKRLFAEKTDLSQGIVGLALKDSLQMGKDIDSQKDYFIKLLNNKYQFLKDSNFTIEEEVSMYDPGLIKTSIEVSEIETKLAYFYNTSVTRWKPNQLTFLFHGPSGTGKTALVEYLAKKLNKNLISLSASTLQDKYVGGTEEKIRSIFKSAEKGQSILFIDEIDSLLRERSGGDKRYEVSQVNEFLVCIEKFKGIFIGATNFSTFLDTALNRRFSDKVEFFYPDLEARAKLVQNYFYDQLEIEHSKLKENLRELSGLTPGHVKAVKQSLAHKDNISLCLLNQELKKVMGKNKNRIGL